MATCPSQHDLARFLDEDLAEPRRSAIARHIDACGPCQHLLDMMTGTQALDVPPRLDEALQRDSTVTELVQRLCRTPYLLEHADSQSLEDVGFPGPRSASAPLGQLAGYDIQARIAAGANGVLYRAVDRSLGRMVAIKVLRSGASPSATAHSRFLREARAAANIKSDHVVRVFQIGSEPDFPPFLVMEFVEGESLRQRLDAGGALPSRRAAELVHQVALGLAAAQRQGLVHRDVKPSNILLECDTGRAKLTDFGLARSESDTHHLTVEGTIAGTPAYMSTEQLTDPANVDGRTDVYSLGVVLYESLTGEVPFRGVLRMVVTQILHDDPVPPRRMNDSIPRDLETICLKAMAKKREDRYASAEAFGNDLERWLNGDPIQARPVHAATRFWRWCRRNPDTAGWAVTAGCLLLLLLLVTSTAAIRLAAAQALAQRHATAAMEQRDAALATLGQLVFNVQDQLDQQVIDLDELQETILAAAVEGLRKVHPQTINSGQGGLQLATAYRRLGELFARIEGCEAALPYFQRSIQILESLHAQQPGQRASLEQLIETLWSLSDVNAGVNAGTAAAYARQAVAHGKLLMSLAPDDPTARRKLAESQLILGQCSLANSDEKLASESFAEAVRVYASLIHGEPDNSDLISPFLDAMHGMALTREHGRDYENALDAWRAMQTAAEKYSQERPELVGLVRYRFAVQDGLERTLRRTRREGSPRERQRSRTLLQELLAVEATSSNYAMDVTESLEAQMDEYERYGDLRAASRFARRIIAFLDGWLSHSPRDALARYHLGAARLQMAVWLQEEQKFEAAFHEADAAIQALRPLTDAPDRDPDDLQLYVESVVLAAELQQDLGDRSALSRYLTLAKESMQTFRPDERNRAFLEWETEQNKRMGKLD